MSRRDPFGVSDIPRMVELLQGYLPDTADAVAVGDAGMLSADPVVGRRASAVVVEGVEGQAPRDRPG